jgi:starch-binding outer membrane protein, SusD/RagB family
MKNIEIKIIISFFTLFSLNSCDNSLDLQPEDSLTPNVIFASESTTRGAVEGMYSQCQNSSALSGIYDSMMEWQSDNVEFSGSFPTFIDISNYTTLSNNGNIFTVWFQHYNVIDECNNIIKSTPGVPSSPTNQFTTIEKDDLIGQAKFIRALMYLRLSSCFGHQLQQNSGVANLSVPIVLLPSNGVIGFPQRATLGAVHLQIENDLLDAVAKILPANTNRNKATVGSAKALLARLYLYQERWSDAANYANQVINTTGFTFATNYTFYNTINPELIFQLQNIPVDAATAESFSNLYNGTEFNGRGDCPFSQDLKNLFLLEPTDIRYSATLTRNGNKFAGGVGLFTLKYPNAATRADDPNILRISEMFLIRSEANFRGSLSVGSSTPLQDLNRTRTRAGLPNLATVTLTAILNERRKEFCFEGLRRMDLLRNNLPLRSVGMPKNIELDMQIKSGV